ncbi:proteoglycan 4-like isoform X1 [Amphibalanus amphitrite]|uniref:proteoglycan 4-like isoform X1 n=1 Tax=Amphibalanus amphitrite TaxID=1232801 RepID=UPI001C920C04|nr:proteoglycan 4-like isoform X1 [Amphibalanus amphitrite]
MEGDGGRQSTLDPDHSGVQDNELKLVNIDTSGEQASSPTCPLNLLVRSPLANKADLELSDPFLIAGSMSGGGGGGGGDRPVPTDELVDFREKGSREADGSGRTEDGDMELIGDDALEQFGGEADMDNIFQEALALADQFSQLNHQDDVDISLVDSAPQSLPGDNELLSLDVNMLAALAEARRQLPPSQPAPVPSESPLDSSFPAPTGPFTVSSLRSASAAAVAQAAAAASAGGLTPPPLDSKTRTGGDDEADDVAESGVSEPAPKSVEARRTAPSTAREIEKAPEAAAVESVSDDPAPAAPSAAAPTPSRLASRQPRDSLAVASGRRLATPAAAARAPAPARTPAPAAPPPEDDAGYAHLCEQASAEQRELELQADEEYENRQFEQMERRVSREDVLDAESALDSESGLGAGTADSTDGQRTGPPRSQLSRKETYICRPNTGTFKIDKRQRFGTFKVDKTGTFKVPRASASAARSLPPEPPPGGDVNGNQEGPGEETGGGTPASDLNGRTDVQSDSMNNTYCHDVDRFDERSPSPPRGPLSASTPERGDPSSVAAPVSALGRRAAALRRPLTSTPCRSVGSSGSSIGVTPIRAAPMETPEESPVPVPMASLRGPGLRQPAASASASAGPGTSALKQPAALSASASAATGGLRKPTATGLRQPAASGLRQPAASGLRQPAASGLRQPAASGLRQPAASGLRAPAASGLRPPSASGLRAPAAAGASRAAPARQTAAPLRQSSAQSGSDSSVCSVRSLPGPNTSRSNPSLVADRSDVEPALSQRQPRQLPGPASRLPGRGGGVRRSAGGTGSLTNISLQSSHSAAASGLRRPATGRLRGQETSKLSLSQQPAGSERF